ncbi:MAG: preprotein translocase subunit YajC [Phycisphaerales bacterium]|jgi:preprotein translocase subunit YajC
MTSTDFQIALPQTLAVQVPDAPGAPAATPSTGVPGAPGAPGGAAPADPGFNMLLFILPVLVLMVVFSAIAQRKEKKRREALLSAVKKHDRVLTSGGIIGSVVEASADTVVLKVDENSNVRMTFARSAVQQILKESAEAKA